MAKVAAQRQPADPGVADDPAGGGEGERLRGSVELAPQNAARGPGGAGRRVNADRLHQGEVDHDPAVADGVTGHRVPAAADGDKEVALAREPDGGRHIVRAGATGDERRMAIDATVPDAAGLV